MKQTFTFLFKTLFLLLFSLISFAQVSLTGTSYTQNFDAIGTALPSGWTIYTGATASTFGTAATFATAQATWANTGGGFKNVASADGSTSTDVAATQNAKTDRTLAVRQTGTAMTGGDPGAAFVSQFSNTTGFQGFNVSVNLQSLDATSPRTTSWELQYALGASPTSFTAIATGTTGGSTFTNTTLTGSLPPTVNNQAQNLWFRVVALNNSTGTGNRATSGIDDFSLTYTAATTAPILSVSSTAISNLNYTAGAGPSATQNFTVSGNNLAGNVTVAPPATNFEISTDGITFTSSNLTLTPTTGNINQIIYTRLKSGLTANSYSGTIAVSNAGVTTQNVAVSGTVAPSAGTGPCGSSTSINSVRAGTVGTTFTVTGRVISNIGANIYVQDATGGILLYTGTGTTAAIPYPLNIGDQVQATGVLALFNTETEIKNITCFELTGVANAPVTPTTVTTSNLCSRQGELVTLNGVTIPSGGTFAGNTNYTLSGGTVMRIQAGTDLVGATRPTGAVNITGIVGYFNGACQLLPRFIADVPGATANPACAGIGTGGSSIPVNNTLDVAIWNIEWFGNTSQASDLPSGALGPTNDAQQQTNVGLQMQAMQSDIFCLEEVCDVVKLQDQINILNSATGKTYAKSCGTQYYSRWLDSPEVAGNAKTFAQKICFVYNTAVITNVVTSQILTPPPSGNSNWASGRVPLLMSCDATVMGNTKSLKLVGIHAKAGADAISYGRRQADYAALKSFMDAAYPSDNVMIMGDLNDDADQSIYATGGPNPSSFNNFIADAANYNTVSKQLSDCNISSTASFPDIIDHFILSNEIGPDATTVASGVNYVPNSVKVIRPITGGTLTSDHFPVVARFTLGNSALPVTWLSFGGKLKETKIELNWVTASEQQNYMFEIEKSTNPKYFERIGQVKGNGDVNFKNEYQFIDNQPFAGINYYRLKQIDFNGTFSYSKIIAVINDIEVEQSLNIYPNPAINQINIQLSDSKSAVSNVFIYGIDGRLFKHQNTTTIDVSNFNSGTYIIEVQDKDDRVFRKLFVKQ